MSVEEVGGGVRICVSKAHKFGTDALILSDFAMPKKWETACDLCAGCGIVAFLWFRREQRPRHVYAVDIQSEAAELMKESARLSGLSGFAPVLGDLRGPLPIPAGSLDLITCNPPYSAEGTGILSLDPSDRAARHELLCTLDDVFAAAKRLLRYRGRICICHLPHRLSDVITSMRANGFEPKRLRFCQGRPDKAPWLVLVEGKLGGNPGGLKVEPVFLLEQNGVSTPEAKALYSLYRESNNKLIFK